MQAFKPYNLFVFLNKLLIIGLLVIAGFLFYELLFPKESALQPTLPLKIPAPTKTMPQINWDALKRKLSFQALIENKLREKVKFLGINDRPSEGKKILLSEGPFPENEKILYEEPIWIRLLEQGDSLQVHFGLNPSDDEMGKIQIPLLQDSKKKEWEIAGQKVDATLLTRQKAKWMGKDQFLEIHGGELEEKERIDFDGYSCFVKEGLLLFFKEGKWQKVENDATDCPLLLISKIEDKTMYLTLWSCEGDNKCQIKLIRYPDLNVFPHANSAFHYMGSKTKKKWLFEVDGKRVIVAKGDWWLMTQEGWKLLSKPEEIDAFASMQLKGELFVVEGIKEGKIYGHTFNPLRTKVTPVEIPLKKQKIKTVEAKEI